MFKPNKFIDIKNLNTENFKTWCPGKRHLELIQRYCKKIKKKCIDLNKRQIRQIIQNFCECF